MLLDWLEYTACGCICRFCRVFRLFFCMEGGYVGSGNATVKKKRSKISRGPRCESFTANRAVCDTNTQEKEFNILNFSSANTETTEPSCKRIKSDDNIFGESVTGASKDIDVKMQSGITKNVYKVRGSFSLQSPKVGTHMGTWSQEGRSVGCSNGPGNQNNFTKVKLKVGDMTRTIHTDCTSDGASAGGTSPFCSLDVLLSRKNPTIQDTSDNNQHPKSLIGLQGVPWKDFRGGKFSLRKESKDEMPRDGVPEKRTDRSDPVRKSRRVPKRRVLDGEFDDEEDDEIRYLQKLRNLKVVADCGSKYGDNGEASKHQQKVSRGSKGRIVDHEYVEDADISSKLGNDGKMSRSRRGSEDAEEEPTSDHLLDVRSKIEKESTDSSIEANNEMSLTRRQRALQLGKDSSMSLIEFPNGLPPAPSRKHKENLSEVEQQLKKTEAAQRRRMQVEKAARESEAEAIRKILGQDSSRKKREDKLKKQRDELAQERAANAKILPPNTIRWVIGPNGTTVTFSEDVDLPSIFNSKPCSYPPPREKCAGPSCTNPYVYRDSKSKLPLCSLKCYKAIREQDNT